jgi:hypothetical protein
MNILWEEFILGNKMTINKYGFLGKEIKQYMYNLEKQYKEVFDFYIKFNHFINKSKYNIKIKNSDFQGAMIIQTFNKSLTTFQAIYCLYKHYLCNNAENLCRVLFEEMVNIGYCTLGINEAKRYYSLQIINKLKFINTVNQPENKVFFTEHYKEMIFKDHSYDETKRELLKSLSILDIKDLFDKNNKPKAISLEERIDKIGSRQINHYYLLFYRIASVGVHSLPELSGKYLKFNQEGLLKELRWGPGAENCEISSIFASIHFMNIILKYIHNYFGYPKQKDLVRFWEKTSELAYKYEYFIENLE